MATKFLQDTVVEELNGTGHCGRGKYVKVLGPSSKSTKKKG